MKKIIGFFICILLCTVMLTAVGEYIETIDIQGGDDFSTRVNIPVDYYAKYLRVDIDTSLLSSKGPHQMFESIAPADGVYVVSYKTASNKNTMNTLLIGVQTTSSNGWVKTSDGNDGHVIENAKHSIRVAAKKDDALTIDIYASVIIPEKVEMTICFDGYHVPRSANYILKQADCVNDGTRVVSDCMLCGSAVETTGIPALGHDISAEPTVVKRANCTEKGLEAHFCSRCNGMFKMAEIPELGHNFTEELMVIKAATCTEPGIRGHVCNRCGISEDQEEIPARGHIEGREEVVQEATCLEDGLINVYCDRCGELFSNKAIPALGHTEGTEKVIRTASCLQEGLIHVICDHCGEVLSTKTIDKTEHVPGKFEMYKKPTCTTDGLQAQYCTVCGTLLQTSPLPALGHTPGKWEVVREATEEQDGLIRIECTECGEILNSQVIPATGK